MVETTDMEKLSKEELLKILNEKKEKEKVKKAKTKVYIKKYQQTDKGIQKSREANNKYYYNNRETILRKKKEAYKAKKNVIKTENLD